MIRPRINKAKPKAAAVPAIDNAVIARDRQLAEPPPPPVTRMMKHEVNVGDSVCYFADVDDVWEVTELRGPWLRAKKRMHNPPGEANQCFLTDTMVPLELARRLPVRKVNGSVTVTAPRTRRRKQATEQRPTIIKKEQQRPHILRKRAAASAAEKKAALQFCERMREEHGRCETVRVTAERFPHLSESEIIEIAGKVGIKKFTAAIQYAKVHGGKEWVR